LLGNGDGTFQPPVHFAAGRYPQNIAVGDFNRDGTLDLAVSNSDSIAILLGNGDGTFQRPKFYSAENYPLWIAVGDFNGDGNPDLVASNLLSNSVSILLGNGDGTFQKGGSFATQKEPLTVAVADFNSDGNADLAVVSSMSGTFSILLGNGDGTFQPQVAYHVAEGGDEDPYFLAVADFNGDGKPDLAVAVGGQGQTSMLLGRGDGTFQPAMNYAPGGYTLAVADFNGDGIADLATGTFALTILFGKGDGVVDQPVSYGALKSPTLVAVGDFDQDGNLDIAVTDGASGAVSILLNNGGGFLPQVSYAVLHDPVAVAVGDFNGDGNPDLAVANAGSNAVSLLLGNGDGTFSACGQFRSEKSTSIHRSGRF
jgi:hypothetical protein